MVNCLQYKGNLYMYIILNLMNFFLKTLFQVFLKLNDKIQR